MAQKEHLQIKFIFIIFSIFTLGCFNSKDDNITHYFEKIEVEQIPNTTIFINNPNLKLQNGVYYFSDKPFSGYLKSTYNTDTIKSMASYFEGKQHGISQTFFLNGQLETVRSYKNGFAYGRHFGYWENGNIKFDFIYFNDKRQGVQKRWYKSGHKYSILTFSDDREDGMQKAWRENGDLYINYEVKDGIRYGLQKAALCYTLKDEKIK